MTREEAIRYLYSSGMSDEQVNAVVKALEQEPCDDAISRDEVMSLFKTYLRCFVNHENMELFKGVIQELPSVTQKPETVTEFADRCRECGARYGKLLKQEPCEDCISRQAVIDALTKTSGIRGDALKALYDLSPVTPQPKIGHWIKYEHNGIGHVECSECLCWFLEAHLFYNGYCPNCGAKMERLRNDNSREK